MIIPKSTKVIMHGECYSFEHQPFPNSLVADACQFLVLKKCFICVKHQHPTNLASTPVFTQLAVKTKTPLYIFHHENRTPTDLTPQQAGLRKRQAYRRPAAAKKKTGSAEGGVKIDLLVDLIHRAKHCLLFISSDKNIMCEQLKTHASIWKNKTITKVDSKKKLYV